MSDEDEEKGITRFYRWYAAHIRFVLSSLMPISGRHIDAALYNLSPPKATTLYAVNVPTGEKQTLRYDDGTGDELSVPLGGTACEFGLFYTQSHRTSAHSHINSRERKDYVRHPLAGTQVARRAH